MIQYNTIQLSSSFLFLCFYYRCCYFYLILFVVRFILSIYIFFLCFQYFCIFLFNFLFLFLLKPIFSFVFFTFVYRYIDIQVYFLLSLYVIFKLVSLLHCYCYDLLVALAISCRNQFMYLFCISFDMFLSFLYFLNHFYPLLAISRRNLIIGFLLKQIVSVRFMIYPHRFNHICVFVIQLSLSLYIYIYIYTYEGDF